MLAWRRTRLVTRILNPQSPPAKLAVLVLLVLAVRARTQAQQAGAIGEPISLQTPSLPKGFLRQPYHFKLEAQGGILPLKFKVTAGSPAEGIDLADDGTLSGTPTEVGSFLLVVTITDSGKPVRQKKQELTLDVVAPLVVQWSKKPIITGHRLEAAIKVSNQTGQDFDFTLIALAVDQNGRATAVGYQHFPLLKDSEQLIPFGENLARGLYELHVDAVGEVEATNTIYRRRLATGERLEVIQGP
jgi:hypothetical protein